MNTFKYYHKGWPICSIIIQHLVNSNKIWNNDLKIENADTCHPNREAIAAYRDSLGAKSGKSKGCDTDSADEDLKNLENDEGLDFNVHNSDDDKRKDDGDSDRDEDSQGGDPSTEGSGNENDSNCDEEEVLFLFFLSSLNILYWSRIP